MFTPQIYKGIVTSNNDPERKNRIQARIVPELKDVVEQDKLPWLRPFMYQDMSNEPLDVDTEVWCFFIDEFWKEGYWISNQFIDAFYDYDTVLGEMYTLSDSDVQDYPQPFFKRFSDGTTLFHNVVTKETGVYTPFGSYGMFGKYGDIILSNTTNKASVAKEGITFSTSNIFSVSSSDGSNSLVFDSSLNSISMVTTNQIYSRTNNFALEASSKNETVGKVVLEYSSMKERVMATKVESIGGNRVSAIAGNFDMTIAGGAYSTKLVGVTGLLQIKIDANNPLTGITIDAGLSTVFVKGSMVVLG